MATQFSGSHRRRIIQIGTILTSACLFALSPLRSGFALTDDEAPQELANRAKSILETNCHRCHGKDGTVEGGMNYVLDRERLVSRRKIAPGDSSKSKLYQRVSDGEMPPEDESPRPTAADVAVLKRWIDAGAPDFNVKPAKRQAISQRREVLQFIVSDLRQRDAGETRFLRYFTLTHLYNNGLSDDELETYRQGLSKLVNSLSWGPRVSVPVPIDRAKTVLRIDLRDLAWDDATWERIVAANPYRVVFDSPDAFPIATATGSKLAFVRADWFVDAASRPPLYHDVLDLPQSAAELEKQVRVDVARDIQQERVARAGFNNSGISQNNRLIERHSSLFGAYWVSYDFAKSAGPKNLFENPLGPKPAGPPPGSGGFTNRPSPLAFEHDGGEIIFNLPNGLQAYMLVDAKGKRIDKGPTAIVSDPRRPDRAVENGISCMGCHIRGMIPKDDEIRAHVLRNPVSFSPDEQHRVEALYPPSEKFKRLLQDDAARFCKAIEECGVKLGQTEPITALALRFEADLDAATAAAELDVSPATLLKQIKESAVLSRKLGPLRESGGTVKRETFIDSFGDAVQELKIGETLTGSSRANRNPPKIVDLKTELAEAKKLNRVVIHFLKLDPKGPIAGSGGKRYVILCDPKRTHESLRIKSAGPGEANEGMTNVAEAVSCSRCKALIERLP